MRYLLFALMIALLPLRGWVGNAMAVDMASQQTLQAHAQTQTQTQAEGKASPAMPDDCPMHAGATAETATDPLSAGHCTDCDTCELCLALASFTWPSGARASFMPGGGLPSAGHPFSSAEGSTRLKPPIS